MSKNKTKDDPHDIEWVKPLDPADFLGPRDDLYRKPYVADNGKVIDRSKPGPFADKPGKPAS